MTSINEQNSLRIRDEVAKFQRAGGVIQTIARGVSAIDYMSDSRVHIKLVRELAMKECHNCLKPYKPTSGKQKYCHVCKMSGATHLAKARQLRAAQ